MTPERQREIERICLSALQLATPERGRYVVEACGADNALREQVELLLADLGSFLETPAMLTPPGARTLSTVARDGPFAAGARLSDHGPLDDARFAPGHIFASRHRIVSLLGRGAMGEVYRAEDLKLGQAVAIKLVSGGTRSGRRPQRFITEVRLARTITHPNVCRVYDIGEADGWWYVSMELVDGETLQSLLHRIGRLSGEKALDIARQLCAGLAAAHDRGVLHRDLKPSNIMVDGRGQIRILDFGLAVPSGESTAGEIAGTPAYMAPEQVAGGRITEQTDLFALGLVLHELFAGRPLFPIHTLEERRRLGGDASVAHFPPGIAPEVEQLIQSCLDRDPARRPVSALAIAALLPGGDPLAAAIATGVVPSPEMVAAAGPKGALRPAQAWLLLGGTLVGALMIAARAHVMNVVPSDIPKPPDVLAERARNILTGVGDGDLGVDSASRFNLAMGGSRGPEGQRTKVTFVYRQSPRYLVPQNVFRLVTDDDPPSDVPGMATVTLDAVGRLVSFTRVVPEEGARVSVRAPTNWPALFGEAGLDEREFVRAEPDHTARVPHDARLAWNRTSAAGGPLRVTAATLDGHAVQFDATGGIAQADTSSRPLSNGSPAAELALWTLIVSVFAGSAVLARHNLRLGQGDRRGARTLATVVACAGVLAGILRAHHVPVAVDEITFLFAATGWALAWAGLTWLMYISFEPYVRRLWPRTLISWTRLLSGRVRDPLVGRDVLIGMLAGMVSVMSVIVSASAGTRPAYSGSTLESLQSIPHFLNVALVFQLGNSLVTALVGVFLLLLIRLVVRKTWIAVGVALLVVIPVSGIPVSGTPFGWNLLFVLASPLLAFVILLRVGLLAYVLILFTGLLVRVPMTLDSAAWYFGQSLFVLLILAGLATYGFLVALGRRPAFGGGAAFIG